MQFRYYRYVHLIYDDFIDIIQARELLISLDNEVKRHDARIEQQDAPTSKLNIDEFLICEEDIKIIPLYNEAISLSALRYIVEPEEVIHLIRFIGLPKGNTGIHIENHNFGYHFHYGKIKSGKLKRTNLLLTFDPRSDDLSLKPKSPLYYEYHAEGHSTHIDIGTIGANKRKPIYHVCYDEAFKRGIKNFKRLNKHAGIFYP